MLGNADYRRDKAQPGRTRKNDHNSGGAVKRIIPALAIVALILTGCDTGDKRVYNEDATKLHEEHVKLKDGSEITCIKYSSYNQGGLSCDWNNAKEQQ